MTRTGLLVRRAKHFEHAWERIGVHVLFDLCFSPILKCKCSSTFAYAAFSDATVFVYYGRLLQLPCFTLGRRSRSLHPVVKPLRTLKFKKSWQHLAAAACYLYQFGTHISIDVCFHCGFHLLNLLLRLLVRPLVTQTSRSVVLRICRQCASGLKFFTTRVRVLLVPQPWVLAQPVAYTVSLRNT